MIVRTRLDVSCRRFLLLAIALVLHGSATAAAVVTVPAGLGPGNQYRIVFVTSLGTDALSSNIGDYNAFVTGLANASPQLAALGTTWTAIASTETVDAIDNTSTPVSETGIPLYRLDGQRVADDNFDLWNGGYPLHSISITETGAAAPLSMQTNGVERPWVWTGTSTDGTKAPFAFLGVTTGPNADHPVAGVAYDNEFFNPNEWIALASSASSDQHSLYAISGVLTVPEPSMALLGALGVLTLSAQACRRSARSGYEATAFSEETAGGFPPVIRRKPRFTQSAASSKSR